MTTFQPLPGTTIEIDFDTTKPPERFRIAAHPAAPQFAYAFEGNEGAVFQIEREGHGTTYALKVMKAARQSPLLPAVCRRLLQFAAWPGLRVCERFCVEPSTSPRLLTTHPSLRFAMVMPWIQAVPWLQILVSKQAISPEFGIAAARSLARCLLHFETAGASHGDLSSGNVLVDPHDGEVSLVDVEYLHAPGFPSPTVTVLGTPGYNLMNSVLDICTPAADRFSAAVLFGELLAWRDPHVRAASSSRGSFFDPDEVGSPSSSRATLLREALAAHSERIATLFTRAWNAARRGDCPAAREWIDALDALGPATRRGAHPLPADALGQAIARSVTFPQTQELQGPPQIPIDARAPIPQTRPGEMPPSPVAFWQTLSVAPRNDDPVVGWSTNGPLTPKRARDH
jgi:serine/threonine protein kinase